MTFKDYLIEFIQSVGNGKYVVMNHDRTKRLSKPMSKKAAVRRLRQIEWFKNKG